MSFNSIFFLGATGYVGSQLLQLLGRDYPEFHITALVRNASTLTEKVAQLKSLHPNISVVEGTLDDASVIIEHSAKTDIVINTASAGHLESVESILTGLKKASESRPKSPPLYIHMSGLAVLSDNVKGEYVENPKEWSDIDFDMHTLPPTNLHLPSDKAILAAGTSKENPIRTIIIYPGWIYGTVSKGISKATIPVRVFSDMFPKVGRAGTWGPGKTKGNSIHVIDTASACLAVFKAALEGKADEGAEGICNSRLDFAVSREPRVDVADWMSKFGDVLFSKGLVKEGGARPFPKEITDQWGHYGWTILGGNQWAKPERLARLGWEATESKRVSLLDALPAEIDAALEAQTSA